MALSGRWGVTNNRLAPRSDSLVPCTDGVRRPVRRTRREQANVWFQVPRVPRRVTRAPTSSAEPSTAALVIPQADTSSGPSCTLRPPSRPDRYQRRAVARDRSVVRWVGRIPIVGEHPEGLCPSCHNKDWQGALGWSAYDGCPLLLGTKTTVRKASERDIEAAGLKAPCGSIPDRSSALLSVPQCGTGHRWRGGRLREARDNPLLRTTGGHGGSGVPKRGATAVSRSSGEAVDPRALAPRGPA